MAEAKPKFNLHKYVPSEKPGFYDDEVQALIAEGPDTAITIQIPKNSDPAKFEKEVAKHKRWFQESAKRFNRTSRLVDSADQEDGSVHLDFILRDQIKRTRKPKDTDEAAPAEESADTPTVDAA